MGDPFEGEIFPRWVLWVSAAVIVATIVVAGLARHHDWGGDIVVAEAIEAREIRFLERAGGEIEVLDAQDGEALETLAPESDQFIRGLLRSLRRERDKHAVGYDEPVRITRRADGQVTLEDPATGQIIDLRAYGPTNVLALARFLNRPQETEPGSAAKP